MQTLESIQILIFLLSKHPWFLLCRLMSKGTNLRSRVFCEPLTLTKLHVACRKFKSFKMNRSLLLNILSSRHLKCFSWIMIFFLFLAIIRVQAKFCCRSLSSRMLSNKQGAEKLLEFLKESQLKGKPLMINKRIVNGQNLESALVLAVEYLKTISDEVKISFSLLNTHLLKVFCQISWYFTRKNSYTSYFIVLIIEYL